MIRQLIVAAALTPALAFAQAPAAPPPAPEIFLHSPANNATVARTFPVVFGLRNYGVAPAGIKFDRTGHFHIIIDIDPPAPGQLIPPNDSTTRHFGTGVIETTLTLAPGKHTLRVVLGDFEHRVISKELISAPISITVRP